MPLHSKNRSRIRQRIWRRDIQPDQTRICYICGCRVSKRSVTLDHVIPACKGGDEALGLALIPNLQLCCQPCNLDKDDKTLEEYLKGRPWLLFKLAKLKHKPYSYEVLMRMRGIRISFYRFFHKYL